MDLVLQLASRPGSVVALNQFVFLITGVFSTIGYQYVFYSGAAGEISTRNVLIWSLPSEQSTLLPVAANYYGMFLIVFIPEDKLFAFRPSLLTKVYLNILSKILSILLSWWRWESQFRQMFDGLSKKSWDFHTKIIAMALTEIFGQIFSILGIIYAGSGVLD